MTSKEIEHFAERVSSLGLTEIDTAVAILWFLDHAEPGIAVSVARIADYLHELSLAGQVNRSRLKQRLDGHPAVIRGADPDHFKLRLARRADLDTKYLALVQTRRVKVGEEILPNALLSGTRGYLEAMAREVNGCYEYGFYDGAAVLARRLVESLLIDAFIQAGHEDAIKRDGHFVMLNEIIIAAKAGRYVKFARGTAAILDKIKDVGDAAAHHRTHIASRQDVDDIKIGLRRVVSELLHLAKIR